MKKSNFKYLVALSPLVLCGILSFTYTRITPRDVTDLQNPYRTQPLLEYLSTTWFYIGIVLSLVFLSVIVIEDIFNRIQRNLEKRSMEEQRGHRDRGALP